MALTHDLSPDELKTFLDEAGEQLQTLEREVLRLETESDNPDLVQELFRAAHTLKGSSATIGHAAMAEVTHAMENVLDHLRRGQLVPNTTVVNRLLATGCAEGELG